MELSRTQKSAKNALYAIILQIVTVIANFVTKTVMIRYLGIQYAGLSALFADILEILSIAELGFGTAMGYALYQPLLKNDSVKIFQLMRQYRKIYTVIMAVIAVGGFLCLPLLPHIVKDVPDIHDNIPAIFLLYVFKTSASYFLVYKSVLLEANQQKSVVSKVTIVTKVVLITAEAAILALTKNYYLYMAVSILLVVVSNGLVSIAADRMLLMQKEARAEELPKEEKKELYQNVRALAIYKVANTLQRSVGSVIVSMFLGTGVVGVLANYRMITYRTDNLFGQIFEGMRASVGNLAAGEDTGRQYAVFGKMNFLAFAIGNVICTALFVLLTPFVSIWLGEQYLLSTGVVALLALDVYILTMTRPCENFRIANALFVQGKYRPAVMVAINIVLSVLLGKLYGLAGIMLATIIARVSTHVWFDPWLIYRHVFKKPFAPYLLKKAKYFLAFVANCGVTYWISGFVSTGNLYLDFLLMAVVAVTIPNALFLAEFGRTQEFTALKRMLIPFLRRKRS